MLPLLTKTFPIIASYYLNNPRYKSKNQEDSISSQQAVEMKVRMGPCQCQLQFFSERTHRHLKKLGQQVSTLSFSCPCPKIEIPATF